jgi:hypothetical protein
VINSVPILNQRLQESSFFQNLLGLLIVVPEFRLGNFSFQLSNSFTLTINVKDTSSAQRAFPGGFSATQSLHETLQTPSSLF